MDTASHLVIGLGLGAMAHLSPAVSGDPAVGLAVTIGTVLASEAPDLDYAYKFKNTAAYLKKHRGLSHSIPAWFVWPTLITLGLSLFFDGMPWGLIWSWCFASVLIHVGTDILNTFGAQPLLPVSDKRFSIDILQVFDPLLFVLQIVGLIGWWGGFAEPGPLFAWVNTISICYIAARYVKRRSVLRVVASSVNERNPIGISVMPTFRFRLWSAVIEYADGYSLGKVGSNGYREELFLEKRPTDQSEMAEWLKGSAVADTFYYIAERIYTISSQAENQTRLVLTDLRFRYGNIFPFMAVLEFDTEGNLLSERLCGKKDIQEISALIA